MPSKKKFSIETVFKIIDRATRPIKKISRQTKRFARTIKRDFKAARMSVARFAHTVKTKLGNAIRFVAVSSILALGGAFAFMIKQASKMEDATASFTPLLGSVEKAEKLVGLLNKTAATTPFQFEAISKVASQLLPVMDGDLQKLISTFRMLGDTAGGNAQKLDSITRGFTKAMLKGKVDMESLNMIGEAGVPIFTELVKTLNIDKAALFDNIRKGKVSTDDLIQTFKNMTSKGGIFFKGMEIASKTLTGRISTLKDNIVLTAAALGKELIPHAKELVIKITEVTAKIRKWVGENQDLIKQNVKKWIKQSIESGKRLINTIDNLVAAYKFLKPVVPFIFSMIVAWKAYQAVMFVAASAQMVLNGAMTANPVGLVIVAIGALVAAVILLIENWEALWNWFKKMTDNPFFRVIATLMAPLITIPGLIIKHWEPIKEMFSSLKNDHIDPLIKSARQLANILTFGFRNEALGIGIPNIINPGLAKKSIASSDLNKTSSFLGNKHIRSSSFDSSKFKVNSTEATLSASKKTVIENIQRNELIIKGDTEKAQLVEENPGKSGITLLPSGST